METRDGSNVNYHHISASPGSGTEDLIPTRSIVTDGALPVENADRLIDGMLFPLEVDRHKP